ncbi:MAG: lipoprotein-releasing system ATP-binding protein LolD [Deltaproteobacteria bacterium]|jgi:lipoprotein-releasing system ATP-binding protein|nr:MAG: lipoprotein-releasing system ATP-binding protein LolD [Deltaproteobacteria bacterium]
MRTDLLVEVRRLRKVFVTNGSKVEALKGIDIQIKRGETLAVVGVSGSGKSTLLHILGTLDRPTEGEVLYEGEDVFKKNDNELALFRNREIGFVFQFHYLLQEFTALENVMMPLLIQGVDMERAKNMASEVLGRVGLGDRLNHRPGELSGGEQQRVAIGRAVVLKPKIVLADEPTGNLDLATGRSVLDLLLELNRDYGITLVVVTHNPEVAGRMGRRIKLLDGKIVDEN